MQNILKYLFPVPKDDSRRVITFANQEDYISFRSSERMICVCELCFHVDVYAFRFSRHHVYKKNGPKDVDLMEVGPRFELKRK